MLYLFKKIQTMQPLVADQDKKTARKMGKYLAQQDFYRYYYRRHYDRHPERLPKGIELVDRDEAETNNDGLTFAVTISPGNEDNLELWMEDFVKPFWKLMARKRTVKNYQFFGESSRTGRYHLHGIIEMKKTERLYHPSNVKSLVRNCLPQKYAKIMNHKHVHVDRLWHDDGWLDYMTKGAEIWLTDCNSPSDVGEKQLEKIQKNNLEYYHRKDEHKNTKSRHD